MSDILQYTIQSTDESNYSYIKTCLEAPSSPYTKITVTGLTTLCTMILLGTEDYIEINDERFMINDNYSDLNPISVSELLMKTLDEQISVSVSNTNRLVFSHENEYDFSITNASYNMKQITGLYNCKFPIESENGVININSVGFYQSTPILYLVSNIGSPCFQNKDRTYYSQKIVMRIYNSFSPNLPIVCNNAEFSTLVASNALGNVYFKLLDANFEDIKLLSPIYLAVSGERVDIPTDQIPENPVQE